MDQNSLKVFSSSSHRLTSPTNFLWKAFTLGFSYNMARGGEEECNRVTHGHLMTIREMENRSMAHSDSNNHIIQAFVYTHGTFRSYSWEIFCSKHKITTVGYLLLGTNKEQLIVIIEVNIFFNLWDELAGQKITILCPLNKTQLMWAKQLHMENILITHHLTELESVFLHSHLWTQPGPALPAHWHNCRLNQTVERAAPGKLPHCETWSPWLRRRIKIRYWEGDEKRGSKLMIGLDSCF